MTLDRLALARGTLDRAARLRTQPAVLDRLWGDTTTRVLRLGDGRAPVRDDGGRTVLHLVPPAEAPADVLRALLGVDAKGRAFVAVDTDAEDGWATLREVGAVLDDRDAGLLTVAVALLGWHATHQRCPRCGTPTEPVEAGWSRRCPKDGTGHYPRTDPAVIMAVVDDEDRLLLGHQPSWPERRYSTLAGFVEPGESLEAAVRREVAEEVGVVVGDVEYLGSQPWPFPASLMLGFTARAVDPTLRVDGVEINDARWFTRPGLDEATRSGEIVVPPGISIARRLVEHWYGGPLDDVQEAWR